MKLITLVYVIVTRWTWVRAGWKLAAARHRQTVAWANRTPIATWHVEVYWDGHDWRVSRILGVEEHA